MASETSTTWWAERYLQIFDQERIAPYLERASDTVRRRKSIDFRIEPGNARVRLHDAQRRMVTVSCVVETLDEEAWVTVSEVIAGRAEFLSQILSGQLNPALEEQCRQAGVELFPARAQSINVNVEDPEERDLFLAVLYVMFSDALELDPFNVFRLRGIDKEELLYLIRVARRAAHRDQVSDEGERDVLRAKPDTAVPDASTFWSLGESISELTYTLKADELPASLLRRLDSIPLGDLSHSCEVALEEAYAYVANRAQAYALGLS